LSFILIAFAFKGENFICYSTLSPSSHLDPFSGEEKGKGREDKEGVNCQRFIDVLVVVALGKNFNPLHLIKLYGLNHLFRRGLLQITVEINLIHILRKKHQIVQYL
jgi:hypothetical protein